MRTAQDFVIKTLGECRFESPLPRGKRLFVTDDRRILLEDELGADDTVHEDLSLQRAGPRRNIYYDPPSTTVAIVTCGGL